MAIVIWLGFAGAVASGVALVVDEVARMVRRRGPKDALVEAIRREPTRAPFLAQALRDVEEFLSPPTQEDISRLAVAARACPYYRRHGYINVNTLVFQDGTPLEALELRDRVLSPRGGLAGWTAPMAVRQTSTKRIAQ